MSAHNTQHRDPARLPEYRATNDDDLSSTRHRRILGFIGLFLPIVLPAVDHLRRDGYTSSHTVLNSISAYFHTGANPIFVAGVAGIAIGLLSYRGYRGTNGQIDRLLAVCGGLAAVGVALFPTECDNCPSPAWWSSWMAIVHTLCAIVLFACFAVFATFRFTITNSLHAPTHPTPGLRKTDRIAVYRVCGILIVCCMAWCVAASMNDQSIYIPESLALIFFAISWLVKGQADVFALRLSYYTTHPRYMFSRVQDYVSSGG